MGAFEVSPPLVVEDAAFDEELSEDEDDVDGFDSPDFPPFSLLSLLS